MQIIKMLKFNKAEKKIKIAFKNVIFWYTISSGGSNE